MEDASRSDTVLLPFWNSSYKKLASTENNKKAFLKIILYGHSMQIAV